MKIIVVLVAVIISSCVADKILIIPGDNSHYVEGKSRYIWMPDGKGHPHLVDLRAPVDETLVAEADNEYWLYTRRNANNRQLLIPGNTNSILNSNYLGSRPTKVIVHGWKSDGNSVISPLLTSAFLAVQDCNVIVVDWRSFANASYPTSVANVPKVGVLLGNFMSWLLSAGGDWNNVHLVGFGLGAHIVGNAGRTVGGLAKRVTGLDPAGPLWQGNDQTLNTSSGQYVEVIHTDGGILGIFDRLGHSDFYVNGGRHPQPGCVLSPCSHMRAYDIFATTIRQNNLVGCKCSETMKTDANHCSGETLHMGNAILDKKGHGTFCINIGRS